MCGRHAPQPERAGVRGRHPTILGVPPRRRRPPYPPSGDRSVGAAGPRRHRAPAARADSRGWTTAPAVADVLATVIPFDALLLPHRRPGNDPVHRQRQPERRLLRVMAGPPRVRRRGRQQVVLPRPQRPDRRGDQHRHPRRPRPARPGTGPTRPTASATSCACRSSSTASTGERRPSCATPTSPGSPRPTCARWSRWPPRSAPACAAPSLAPADSPYAAARSTTARASSSSTSTASRSRSPRAAERWIGELVEDPPPSTPERVEDRAGGRGPRPRHPARHRPARTGRPSPGAHPLRHLAAAVRHPAQRRLRTADRGDHPSRHPAGRRAGDRARPTA